MSTNDSLGYVTGKGAAGRPGRCAAIGSVLLIVGLLAGCEKLGIGGDRLVVDDGAPDPQQLEKVGYMSSAGAGPKGRKLYTRLEEAKTCADLELALRWNRPPNIESGPFHKKLVYLDKQIPADLPKATEVFVKARIDQQQTVPSGAAVWLLKMPDGSALQAVESSDFWEKQLQDSQQGGQAVAVVQPNKPGRMFCGQGVYQGMVGKDPEHAGGLPLVSMLFSMDRPK